MATISGEKLLLNIKRSGLVSEEDLARCLADWADHSEGPLPTEADDIAELLINADLINRWQAENLLKGKYKGFKLGKYRLLGHLGKGGMSQVYLAEHSVMERLAAIKVLPSRYVENPNYLDRFKREARAVAALDHPNIVRAYDIDQDNNTHYIVMEFVEGRDLQKMVHEDGPLDGGDAADFIAQAALGLQHAHEAGLIHRDVKPANCLVDHRRTLKLLDMGLAKFSEDHHPSISAIHDDSVVGTADYLAPEQARNSQDVDARADIYGLGCTLYFVLTGHPPFPDGSIAQRLLKHQHEMPTSVYEKRPDAPPTLVELCRRMMKKSPEERIQTAAEVAVSLRRWLASRGKTLSAVYTEAKANKSVDDDEPDEGSKWTRATNIRRGTPSPGGMAPKEKTTLPGDTVSSSKDDTSKLKSSGSSVNDDLTLAPLEDERRRKASDSESTSSSSLFKPSSQQPTAEEAKKPLSGDEASASDVPSSSQSDTHALETPSSVQEVEDLDVVDSGPLDALLDDPSFASGVQLPRTQLTTRREKKGWDWKWIAAIVGAAVAAIIVGFVIVAVLLRP